MANHNTALPGSRAQPDWAYEFPDRTGPDTKIYWTKSGLIFLNILNTKYKDLGDDY